MKPFNFVKNIFKPQNKQINTALTSARHFLKYGNTQIRTPDWSQVLLTEQDAYSGILYGAINVRAVALAQLATNNLITTASDKVIEKAKAEGKVIEHPYLEIIDKSKTFSNYQFWSTITTYLDLEGLMYIMAVRAISPSGLVGNVQEFKLLNPFNVQRKFDSNTKELVGYTEYRGTMSRDIPKEMIIPIINLNPFDETPFSMVDAVKEHQFTLKAAGDYTRAAISNNINSPGIIATDKELSQEELEDFKARVIGKVKGEPIFGGGKGSVTWSDMQADLNKSALTDVNNISLQNIVSVSGASKTMLGWEESGTTRETAKVQRNNFIEMRVMPQLQLIIDALNQDYKIYNPIEYERDRYTITIENPLASNVEQDLKETECRQKEYDLYQIMVDNGYDREETAKFVNHQIELEELNEPDEPKLPPQLKTKEPEEEPKQEPEKEEKQHIHTCDHEYINKLETGVLESSRGALQNAVVNIDNKLIAEVVKKVGKKTNDFKEVKDMVSLAVKAAVINELDMALGTFYGIIMPLYAYNVMSERLETYSMTAQFNLDPETKKFIKSTSKKVSEEHISNLLADMMYSAQQDSLEGLDREMIANNLLNKYGNNISEERAKVVARTETNRAFTMAQYSADRQFLEQNGITNKAYKKWIVRSSNPCPFCQAMSQEPPIPFNQPFAQIGDELEAVVSDKGKTKVSKMTVGFLDAEAGNLHPNCGCAYELIIEGYAE